MGAEEIAERLEALEALHRRLYRCCHMEEVDAIAAPFTGEKTPKVKLGNLHKSTRGQDGAAVPVQVPDFQAPQSHSPPGLPLELLL